MPRVEQRIVTASQVELMHLGRVTAATSQDLSRRGIFVRTREFLPCGELVDIRMHLTSAGPAQMRARVSHVLTESAGLVLGREPGLGFEFVEEDAHRRRTFEDLFDDLRHSLTPLPVATRKTRVLLAQSSPRFQERVVTALRNAGFVVEVRSDGGEAYVACLGDPPQILLTDAEMPVVDGWTLIKMLGTRAELAGIPVVLMSDDASDITRLKAFRHGVIDFIPKPFTIAELCIRMRRLARSQQVSADRVVLRGSITEIGPGTLLSLFDVERKSGVLAISNNDDIAWISVNEGSIAKVELSAGSSSSFDNLMKVLDWRTGDFEFTACPVDGVDELGIRTTHLLLEHARLQDERSR